VEVALEGPDRERLDVACGSGHARDLPGTIDFSRCAAWPGAGRAPGDPGYQNPAGFSKGTIPAFRPGFPCGHPLCSGVLGNEPHDS
jgi:hypothetical protein